MRLPHLALAAVLWLASGGIGWAGEIGGVAAGALCAGILAPLSGPAPPSAAPRFTIRRFEASDKDFALSTALSARLDALYGQSEAGFDRVTLAAILRRINECLYASGYPTTGATALEIADDGTAVYRLNIGRTDAVSLSAFDRSSGTPEPGFVVERLRARLLPDPGQPFSLAVVEQGLRQTITEGFVGHPSVEVLPDDRPGAARVVVRTERPTEPSVTTGVSNTLPKAIGSTVYHVSAQAPGFMPGIDRVSAVMARGAGFTQETLGYDGPLGLSNHRFSLSLGRSASHLMGSGFSDLDIRSRSADLDGTVTLALLDRWTTSGTGLDTAIAYDHARALLGVRELTTRTTLLGEPFSFDPYARDGKLDLLEFTAGLEAGRQGQSGEFTLRLRGRYGTRGLWSRFQKDFGHGRHAILDGTLDATHDLPWWNTRLRFRGHGQWGTRQVMPPSRYVLGGGNVRGVEPEALSGDSGHAETVELILPLLDWGAFLVDGLAFVDRGAVRLENGAWLRLTTAGGGVRLKLDKRLDAELTLSRKLSGPDGVRAIGNHHTEGVNFALALSF